MRFIINLTVKQGMTHAFYHDTRAYKKILFSFVYFATCIVSANSIPVIKDGWLFDGKLIQGHCIEGIDSSNESLEDYAEAQGIPKENFEDFIINPGKYLGNEIKSLDPIEPNGWPKGETYSFAYPVSNCLDASNYFDSGTAGMKAHSYEFYDSYYVVRAKVDLNTCQSLIDHKFNAKCDESYLISIMHRMGSGSDWSHGIYGLLTHAGKQYIVPLKHWQLWFNGDGDARKTFNKAYEFINNDEK